MARLLEESWAVLTLTRCLLGPTAARKDLEQWKLVSPIADYVPYQPVEESSALTALLQPLAEVAEEEWLFVAVAVERSQVEAEMRRSTDWGMETGLFAHQRGESRGERRGLCSPDQECHSRLPCPWPRAVVEQVGACFWAG